MEPMEHTTTPTYFLYHSYLLSGIPGGWSLFYLSGNHAVVLVLWDVHIIAGWLSCVLHLLLLALMIPPLYVAIDRSPQKYKRQ